MTKSLQEIQKENRKFILEAIHGCSYEEALKKELGFGCRVIDKKHQFFGVSAPEEMTLVYGDGVSGEESDPLYFSHLRGNPFVSFSKQEIRDKDRFEIIGQPLTLSRVLLALKDKLIGYYDDGLGYIVKRLFSNGWYHEVEYICDWDLTKETLEEQSEETQRRVNKLLTGE